MSVDHSITYGMGFASAKEALRAWGERNGHPNYYQSELLEIFTRRYPLLTFAKYGSYYTSEVDFVILTKSSAKSASGLEGVLRVWAPQAQGEFEELCKAWLDLNYPETAVPVDVMQPLVVGLWY